MASVDSIISHLATDIVVREKFNLNKTGRDQPVFVYWKKTISSIGTVFKTNLAYCMSHSKITASVLRKMRELDIGDAFPDVTNALKASLTVVLTSVTCERNFSVVGSSLSSL